MKSRFYISGLKGTERGGRREEQNQVRVKTPKWCHEISLPLHPSLKFFRLSKRTTKQHWLNSAAGPTEEGCVEKTEIHRMTSKPHGLKHWKMSMVGKYLNACMMFSIGFLSGLYLVTKFSSVTSCSICLAGNHSKILEEKMRGQTQKAMAMIRQTPWASW